MRFDGIIFDVDGTLWDSCQSVADSWTLTLSRRFDISRQYTAQDIAAIMGMTNQEIAQFYFGDYGEQALEIVSACTNDEPPFLLTHGAHIYPGVKKVITMLSRKYPLYIVSNCQKGYIETFLEYSGLAEYITGHLCEGDTGLKKSGNIRRICELHNLKAPVYIGDTVWDENSAREANCAFIHAAYGFGKADSPLASIDSPAELLDIL